MFNKILNLGIIGGLVYLVFKADNAFSVFGNIFENKHPGSLDQKTLDELGPGFISIDGIKNFFSNLFSPGTVQADVFSGNDSQFIEQVLKGRYGADIEKNARELSLPPTLIAAIIWRESSGNPHAANIDGELGLMQVIPRTNEEINSFYGAHIVHAQNKIPAISIRQGSRYLKMMFLEFGDLAKAVQAYNVGPGAVKRNEKIERRKKYLNGVLNRLRKIKAAGVF